MARGQRSNKGGQGVNTKRPVEAGNRQTEDDLPQQTASTNNKSGTSAARNRNKHKNEEEFRAMDESPTNTPAATSEAVTSKREHHPKATPQPTSEQIMIAQLIGGDTKSDDPNQRQKIQKVMDITGKEEDAVSTALFDAAWDENRAIEILLEDGDQLSAWEESGSKKRKNKLKQAADDANKDDWDDAENFNNQDGREKSRSRGPPRMRRGGSQAPSGGGNHRNNNNAYRDQASHEREELRSGGGPQSRGAGPRRGDPSSRRGAPAGGGVSRGGGRAFQSRQQKPEPQGGSAGVGAFSGSIDTWNNPPSISGSGGGTGTAAGERGGSSVGSSSGIVNSGAAPGGPAGPGPQRRTRGSGGKDAFDNAGNWGDDFPPADDWDNEEYTGSLADTKVFTARSSIGGPAKPTGRPQGPSEPQQVQQPPNSTVIGPNRSFSSTVNGPASAAPGVPPTSSVSSYSQSIDLSTLLQKPTTQSSLNASTTQQQQQQALLQFAQQGTETLRAGLGIGQNNTVGANRAPGNLNSYSPESNAPSAPSMERSFTNQSSNSYVGQGSAFTSIKPSGQVPSSNGSPNGPAGINLSQQRTSAPPPSKVPAPSSSMQQSAAAAAVSSTQSRSRMPPSSKIPSSAVEMPGDNATQLDVQFGGLDLKFGGSANDGSGMGGFEYTSSGVSSSVDDQTSKYLSDKAGPKPVVSSWGMKTGGMPIVSVSSNMPAVSYPSNKMGDGNQSSISASSILPKSTSAGGINSNVFASSQQQQLQQQQQQQQRSQSGVMDMKSVQQQQQQHQNDSIGSYYSNYGQQQSKPYHHQSYGVQNQYSNYNNQNSYQNSSPSGYGSQNNYSSSSTQSSGYKMPSSGGNQYQQQPQQQQHDSLNKFDSMTSSSSMAVQNAAAAVLGLTTTTNALSGKVSATTAGKVPSVPSIPPGVASMLPQHYMASLPPAAFYGLQQPAAAMYSAYGGTGGLEDLAALQRSAGLHTLVGASNNPTVPQPGAMKAQPSSGYYDPTSQYAANSLAAGGGGSRNDGSSNLNSIGGNNTSSSATGGSGSSGSNSNSDKAGGFGAASGVVSSTDSNSSPIPSTGLQSNQQSQQQQQAAAQATFNLAAASNAFAAQQHMPPGYAYFYGSVPGLQAYGATAAASAQYPGTVPMTVPTAGGSSTSQFQKTYGYGSAYDTLGQPGNKDFSSSYSTGNGAGKSSGGGSQAPAAGGHQYWGNSPLASGQLW